MIRLSKLHFYLKYFGPRRTIRFVIEYSFVNRQILKSFVIDRKGLEIGGPTSFFFARHRLPIYPYVRSLDNINFSSKTIWNQSDENAEFSVDNKTGKQLIMEASDLRTIENESYEFVVSSHVIEHLSNPIKSVMEMKRVLKTNGFIIMVAPHKETTFDRKRPTTTSEHLINDFKTNIKEGDISHLNMDEIVANYDYDLDPGISGKEEFIERTGQNNINRALHQHVFITETIIQLFDYCDLKIILCEPKLTYRILVVAQKTPKSCINLTRENNKKFISNKSSWRSHSPYLLDKIS